MCLHYCKYEPWNDIVYYFDHFHWKICLVQGLVLRVINSWMKYQCYPSLNVYNKDFQFVMGILFDCDLMVVFYAIAAVFICVNLTFLIMIIFVCIWLICCWLDYITAVSVVFTIVITTSYCIILNLPSFLFMKFLV